MGKFLIIFSLFVAFFISCGQEDSPRKPKVCNPECEEWKSCIDGVCKLKIDRCETNEDCVNRSDSKINCNLERHECETAPTTECTANEKRCNGDKLELCKADGSAWELSEDCGQNNKICDEDTFSCKAKNNDNCIGMSFDTIEVKQYKNELIGTNGNYQLTIGFYEADSPVGVYDLASGNNTNYATCNQCVTVSKYSDPSSPPDKTFFQSSGKLEITKGDGRTGESVGEIVNIKLIEVTIEDGTYKSTPVENGECMEIETGKTWEWNTLCTEGNKRCNEDDNTIEVCQADHTWAVETACLENEECTIDVDNGIYCKAPYCIIGEKRCNENGNIEICKSGDYGNFWDIFENCTNGTVCEDVNFTCVEPPCVNGDKKCNASATGIRTCVNGQWQETLCDMNSGEVCMGSGDMITCGIPSSDTNWIKISVNSVQSCGIKSVSGVNKLYCWGTGSFGRLGNGDEENKLVPTEVNIADNSGWTDVSVGRYHACGLKAGKIYCWGKNDKGQLGNGNNTDSLVPVEISGDNNNYLELEVGGNHSCGLKTNGKLYCWGRGDFGQLGNNTLDNSNIPVEISGNWLSFSLGEKHSCGIQDINGVKKLYCWGSNMYGRLGIDSDSGAEFSIPTEVYGDNSDDLNKEWVSVFAGYDDTCAIKTSGKMYCWGHGNSYKLGTENTDNQKVPTEIVGDNWVTAGLGYYHSCGIQNDNGVKKLYCWGRGDNGRLGLNTTDDATTPTQLTETGWTQITAALAHTCGIKEESDGVMSLYCWGKASNGRLGNGDDNDSLTPSLIP